MKRRFTRRQFLLCLALAAAPIAASTLFTNLSFFPRDSRGVKLVNGWILRDDDLTER